MNTLILAGPDHSQQYKNLVYHASGGMGTIYKAEDTINGNIVAIKIIQIKSKSEKQLLIEEFKIAEALSHENIIRTYYYGEFTDDTGSFFYNTMDFYQWGSLREVLHNRNEFLPIETCLSYFKDLLSGLHVAHALIIHRDLKPENILLNANNRLMICDFGIAKYVNMKTRNQTFKGHGTEEYASPEVWQGFPNTNLMDIYSLGIVFFEIITNQLPFQTDFKHHHLYSILPKISGFRSDVPFYITEIIRKMTNKRPADRYKSAKEILEALQKNDTAKQLEQECYIAMFQANAHNKIKQTNAEILELEKRESELQQAQQALTVSVDNLFNQFTDVADNLITGFADKLITYKPYRTGNPRADELRLKCFDFTIIVSFYNTDIKTYFQHQQKQYIENQKRHYGYVMQPYTPSYIEIDNVSLIGKVSIVPRSNRGYHGFNLVLIKDTPEDIYSHWKVCKFFYQPAFNNVPDNFYSPIDTPSFFEFYNSGRQQYNNARPMIFKELEKNDIIDLFNIITSSSENI